MHVWPRLKCIYLDPYRGAHRRDRTGPKMSRRSGGQSAVVSTCGSTVDGPTRRPQIRYTERVLDTNATVQSLPALDNAEACNYGRRKSGLDCNEVPQLGQALVTVSLEPIAVMSMQPAYLDNCRSSIFIRRHIFHRASTYAIAPVFAVTLVGSEHLNGGPTV